MSVAYAIDTLRIREGRCFGWGFLLDPDAPATHWELHLETADGATAVIHGVPGGSRPDLAEAFPHVRHAAASGFLLQGALSQRPAPGRDARLEVTLRDGRRVVRMVPSSIIDGACDVAAPRPLVRLRSFFARHGVRRTWRELAMRLRARIAFALALRTRSIALVIDHDMGGGANVFRRSLVNRLAAVAPCFVLTPVVDLLAYRLVLHLDGRSYGRVEYSLESIFARLDRAAWIDLHVNEVVSFPDPPRVLGWCQAVRESGRAALTFYLHDFHSVCPAWTLMGREDRFCGIPAAAVCATCLPANRLHTLGFAPPGLRIDDWRSTWRRFLGACDRIRAFSKTSVEILGRVYPEIAGSPGVEIAGHEIQSSLRPARLPARMAGDPVVVACAGHISVAKGARMLQAMARAARARSLPLRFVVFGSLDGFDGGGGIDVVGKYDREALPELLERHGVTLAMLPSVCVETFSFVTAEFMQMQVPVAVFPIGAPAERVAGYEKGLVISQIDPDVAVDEILAFADRLPGARAAQAIHN